MTDKSNANGFPSKASENGERRRQLPYSVETPYGFHLDLDFLKYVDDIEKGNTIRRVHIHRRNRAPKFSTLPRNFSLPSHGYRPDMWASTGALGPKPNSQFHQVIEFRACDGGYLPRSPGPGCKALKAMEDASIRAFDEQPLGFRVRPYLLRATSMPVTVLQRKCSETSDDQGSQVGDACWENGSAENVFCTADLEGRGSSGLHQQLAVALQRIRELEEQARIVTELKAQIGALQKEKQQLLLRVDGQSAIVTGQKGVESGAPSTESPSVEEVDVGVTEGSSGSTSQQTVAALQTKLTGLQQKISQSDAELEKTKALLREVTVENKLKEDRIKELTEKVCVKLGETGGSQSNGDLLEVKASTTHTPTCDSRLNAHLPTSTSAQDKNLTSSSTQTDTAIVSANVRIAAEESATTPVRAEPWETHGDSDAERNPQNTAALGGSGGSAEAASPGEVDPQCTASASKEHQQKQEADRPGATHTAVGHHITRIQQLLQEQWACLSAVDSDSTSILQPDSKISSIQAQLVSSLHTLSSLHTSSARNGGATPHAALKSIMKKDYAVRLGNGGAKKNLKFVGVNGGYETTSSEESSGEDNVEGDGVAEGKLEEGASQGLEDPVGQGAPSGESTKKSETPQPRTGPQEEPPGSGPVDEDFMAACHFLKDRLEEVASPDKEMRQVLTKLYQEWFRVSSQEDSPVDTVAAYLRQVRAATPTLLPFVVNLADGNGNTALHYSVSHSNFHIVKLLLDTGVCDVDLSNKAGYTAIMLVSLTTADTPEDVEVARQLLELGDTNARASQAEQTALMLAAGHGRSVMVRLLLGCRADPNAQDRTGTTALMSACESGHAEVVRLLLEHGCDTGLTDSEGRSALSLALQASHSEIADLLHAHGDASPSDPAGVL
ncbi:KN motif and ankyrin repeat domain-containing protein 4-like [Megalops cyprinoides]|uniref:KN motif and ankyrin repeat domain-containing protein 4-like n=1 Tax=Megalops cyprinoides TaxID=118141 RepID=UPI00186510A2|nr:KN motif and ankyrin repeat domain-containing protein 4-like [Megalops cyprinoides]XP_036410512.1 KN motif and ankyrin repeat domain-containing protein 4-like [Megalops cyprinoides]